MTEPDSSAAPPVDRRVLRTRQDVLGVAIRLLLTEGWESVTHQRVAGDAGYSKQTLYAHWPGRTDLLRDAFGRFGEIPHSAPSGDLRADLVAELVSFRDAMRDQHLDRALAVLADLAFTHPELAAVRAQVVRDGEGVIREILRPVRDTDRADLATKMLCGFILQSALLHADLPGDELIATAVDMALAGLDADRR